MEVRELDAYLSLMSEASERLEVKRSLKRLKDGNAFNRSVALRVLFSHRLPQMAVIFTGALASDSSMRVRATAAECLGRLGDPSAVSALCDALQLPDLVVKRNAAIALRRLGDLQAVVPLCGVLEDSDEVLVSLVADALELLAPDSRDAAAAVTHAVSHWETRSWPVTQKLRRLAERLQPGQSDLPIPSCGPSVAPEGLPVVMQATGLIGDDLPRMGSNHG